MRVFFLFLTLLMTACVPTPTVGISVQAESSPTQERVAPSQIPPTATPTLTPNPTATSTIIPTETPIPCDAYESFCVEDGHFLLARPIDAEKNNKIEIAYRYGSTLNGKRDPHHGVEFINEFGTPILAVAEGRVIYADKDKPAIYTPWERFYGNLVVIEHNLSGLDAPLYTLYAHLSTINVEKGEIVQKGQPVGNVGMSGGAVGSHLHFEVRMGESYTETRNPELWLMPLEENHGAIVVQIADERGKLIRVPLIVEKVGGAEDALKRVASLEAYAPEKYPVGGEDKWQETHAIAGIPSGKYRLSFSFAGQYWERFIEVYTNKVSVVYFVVE